MKTTNTIFREKILGTAAVIMIPNLTIDILLIYNPYEDFV